MRATPAIVLAAALLASTSAAARPAPPADDGDAHGPAVHRGPRTPPVFHPRRNVDPGMHVIKPSAPTRSQVIKPSELDGGADGTAVVPR